uniref:Transmembrane protein n=1 Tax=Talaromyces marneffei PM1 TaxID=1077442 RepID=A0A093Y290_TALMA
MDPDTPVAPEPAPSPFNYILSFILVGIAWGFTTPFIRRAAVEFNKRQEETNRLSAAATSGNEEDADGEDEDHDNVPAQSQRGRFDIKKKISSLFWTVVNLLRTPGYAIPLVVNLTGSVWFFLLVGKHELSLTVPISNSMAFLFTVLGEWIDVVFKR